MPAISRKSKLIELVYSDHARTCFKRKRQEKIKTGDGIYFKAITYVCIYIYIYIYIHIYIVIRLLKVGFRMVIDIKIRFCVNAFISACWVILHLVNTFNDVLSVNQSTILLTCC